MIEEGVGVERESSRGSWLADLVGSWVVKEVRESDDMESGFGGWYGFQNYVEVSGMGAGERGKSRVRVGMLDADVGVR